MRCNRSGTLREFYTKIGLLKKKKKSTRKKSLNTLTLHLTELEKEE